MCKDSVSRRDFLRAGTAAAAAAATFPTLASDQTEEKAPGASVTLARRKLGRTGVDVTILSQGTAFDITDRHFNMMHGLGIRYIDTAKSYLKGGSERAVAAWLEKSGHRKDYFVVTKDEVRDPSKWMAAIDERLVALKTDYIDLFFLHGFGDSDFIGPDKAKEALSDQAWRQAADQIRKSGKCKFLGFSTHTNPIEDRAKVLQLAASGSWVDAIMVAADPTSIRESTVFNKALDACHDAGIGLISMKENMGGPKTIDKVFPTFETKGLSSYTAVLYAMWTDERFACICSHMDTLEKLEENAKAAAKFKPLSEAELTQVDTMLRDGRRTFCVACDGRCRNAAGTHADLNKIARYVSYAEDNTRVYEARDLLRSLPPESRNWSDANLKAASHACQCRLDFAKIIRRAEELLA